MKKTSRKAKPQILKPIALTRCAKCGKIVKWRVTNLYKCADGKHLIRYLECPTPGCDGRARQTSDVAQ